jgi:hypothetical protein
LVIAIKSLEIVSIGFEGVHRHESAAYDCSAHPQSLALSGFGSEGADRKDENQKAISKEENCP